MSTTYVHPKWYNTKNMRLPLAVSRPYQPVRNSNNFPHSVVTRFRSACGWRRLAALGNPGLPATRMLHSRRRWGAASFRSLSRSSSKLSPTHPAHCKRVTGMLPCAFCKCSNLEVASFIRRIRSALHCCLLVLLIDEPPVAGFHCSNFGLSTDLPLVAGSHSSLTLLPVDVPPVAGSHCSLTLFLIALPLLAASGSSLFLRFIILRPVTALPLRFNPEAGESLSPASHLRGVATGVESSVAALVPR